MANRILWVDDIRDPFKIMGFSPDECVWVTSFHEAVNMLSKRDDFTAIYLDNDLGEASEKEGGHVLNHIEEKLFFDQLEDLQDIYVHSDNASAVRKMLSAKDVMEEKYGVTMGQLIIPRSAYQ